MNIVYNRYNEPIQGHVYLGTPNGKILCAINGIEENTFQLTPKYNNTFELSFDLNENILIQDGKGLSKLVHSNVYDLVGWLMRVYVDNVGWFIMQHPKISDDGMKQTKTITCQSAEIEMQQHDLKNFKINQGTTDSYEMLADGNVEKIDDVEFAKEQIKFYNPSKPQLSLIDLALKAAGMKGWSVGEIDSTPKKYRTYKDGKYVETATLLSDEIGSFDIESQDLYSFFTQDMAKYFQCVFVFDFLHMKISAYHPENYGKNTNVNINFRNLQQSQEISVDDSNMYTRYYVQGADDLGITYVNFGSNYIENIDYYLNEKYFSPLLITKYKLWKEDYEEARILYIEATRKYNEQMKVVTELYDRVPLDDCSTDWSTFTDDELKEAQANYQAQLKGYEQFYVDDDGNFDENALKNSSDANDYYQIKDVILPSIQIEMDNRQLPTDDDNADYVDSYKTDWKLYGLDELKVKLQEYKNTIETCKKGGYDKPYSDDSSHTQDIHNEMYAKYQDAKNQLDENYVGGCQEAYNQRQSEIDAENKILENYNKTRTTLNNQVTKETWQYQCTLDKNGYLLDKSGVQIIGTDGSPVKSSSKILSFSEKDLLELSKVYYDADYSNENMFLTDSDDQVSTIDEQLKLFDAATETLYIASHPQYQYTTSLDNFLALSEYSNYTKNINQGDYLWLTVNNNTVVKLRLVEIQYNPLIADNNIQLTFSNMIQGKSGRDDLSYLLDLNSGGSKSSASGSSNNFLNNEGITLTAGLIQKLIANGAFKNGVSQIINNEFAGMLADSSISLKELNAKIIKVTDLYGENGYFEYLQSKLITAGKIVADSADFKELSALAATIKSAIIGASSTETGIVINLTTENATMSEAMIKDLIAKYITVNELKAGDIYTNKIKILSEDGTLRIQDNTFSICDKDGNVVVQLGEDKNGNYGLIISDSKGSVLLDSQGLHEGIVPDDFIKTDMIADGQITESKIDKTTMRDWTMPDGSKVFDVSHLWDGDDSFGKSYNTIKSTVSATSKELGDLSDKVDQLGNGYTVVLSNETQNIPCTADGLTATSFLIEIPFYGYEGIKQAACTVTVGELPDGITLAENTAATATAPGKIILNVAKDKTLGNKTLLTGAIVFTCIVSGKTISKKFTWIKSLAGKDGSQGIQGEDAVLYEIEPSVAVIKKCTLDVCSITDESGNRIVDEQGRFLSGYFLTDSLSPSKVTFTAYKQVGNQTRTTYACRFIIQESLNGLSWSTKYTSSKDETSVSYTPSTLKLQQIKCVMYRTGGITEQLDSQTVPVIQDAEGYDSVIQTFTDTFASVELKVDNNAKAITLKAEQKDITNAINSYDQTTVKSIRDQQTEQKVNIDGISTKVSDIETTVNGSVDDTKTGLVEKVTQVTQKAGTIEANLKNNYTTTEGMNSQISAKVSASAKEINANLEKNYTTTTGMVEKINSSIAASADKIKVTLADGKTESTLKAALGEIQQSVKDNAGNISTVTQKANSLETKVTNQGNDIANLKVDAKAIQTLVASSAGETDVVQKATDFRKTITDAAGNANLALSTANSNKNVIANMKVGAANTIRNSNDLIYDFYYMVANLLDESGNRIVAENGDYLVAYY